MGKAAKKAASTKPAAKDAKASPKLPKTATAKRIRKTDKDNDALPHLSEAEIEANKLRWQAMLKRPNDVNVNDEDS